MPEAGQDRTEKATPRRMKKVRREGNLMRSQDLTAWVIVGVAAAVLGTTTLRARHVFTERLSFVAVVAQDPDRSDALRAIELGLGSISEVVVPLFIFVVIAALIGAVAQGGFRFAPKKLAPQFKNLNPIQGFRRMFGLQSLWQAAKALLKTAVVGIALFFVVKAMIRYVQASGRVTAEEIVSFTEAKVNALLWVAVIAGLALAVIDVAYVMKRNRKQTKMTKQEIKDEYKSTEGDPQIKGAIRSRQLAMSRNRMLAAVGDADVVIANPTHVAVALQYRSEMGVPKVLAKGRGVIALRIKEQAAAQHIPIVDDPPLARALEASSDVGGPVSRELFTAVAQVLAFVILLRRRGVTEGEYVLTPERQVPIDVTDRQSIRRNRRRHGRRTPAQEEN
jgi:flagellar biosynthetic protein FlhB